MEVINAIQAQEYKLLVVDDEPDVFEVTKLSLKSFKHNKKSIKLLFATSGQEAINIMQSNPDIAVILLDVVMETDKAGFEACQVIRENQKNKLVRILLRTGQPGVAPEKESIDQYDIDGYLPKAELTTTRLYSAVRTAIRAWDQLLELERFRELLAEIHECAISLQTFEPIEKTLERILKSAVFVSTTKMGVLKLESFYEEGNPHTYEIYMSTELSQKQAKAISAKIIDKINQNPEASNIIFPSVMDHGYYIPFKLHRELGQGWIYLDEIEPDDVVAKALILLAAHAQNALYATVALELLNKQRKEPFYTMTNI